MSEEELKKLAEEKFPIDIGSFTFNKGEKDEYKQDFDENEEKREGFIAGYKAALQSLEDRWIDNVLDFHIAMGVDYYETPTLIPLERIELRQSILNEEIDELETAMNDNNIPLIADAIVDSIYVLIGTAWEYGLGNILDKMFQEVHRSNMSKLHDGKCIKREDGKVLKSPNYSKPNLEKIIKWKIK